MPLQGTFDVLDFAEMLRLLARQQVTGRVHVRSRSFGANLFIEDGALVGADQSEHQATAATGDVRGRVEEICFELLDSERGTFEFTPGRPSVLPSSSRLNVDTVLQRARKRLEEWQELQEALPSLDLQPRLAEDLESAEVTIDQERWRVLTVIDGRRNLRAIGRTLSLSDFEVCRIVKGLLDDGIVELDVRTTAVSSALREAPAAVSSVPREATTAVAADGADREPAAAGRQPAAGAAVAPAPSTDVDAYPDGDGEEGDEDGPEEGTERRRRLVRIRSRSDPTAD